MKGTGRIVYCIPARENRASNPYTTILADGLERLGWTVKSPRWADRFIERAAIVHVHWPQKVTERGAVSSLRSVVFWLAFLRWQKLRGAQLVWTTHNLASHEEPNSALESWYMRVFAGLVDGVISLSQRNLEEARVTFPVLGEATGVVIPHFIYGDYYPAASSDAGTDVGLIPTISFLGDIKRYKGLDTLFDALERAEPDSFRYLIHGRCSDAPYAREIDSRIGALRQRGWTIDHRPTRLSDQEMVDALAQTDLLLLPYESGENSGLAILAGERAVPVFVSAVAAFDSLVDELGPRMATRFVGGYDHAALVAALASTPVRSERIVSDRFRQARSPGAAAARTSRLYLDLLGEVELAAE